MASSEAVVRAMLQVSDSYPNVKFSETAPSLWCNVLSDISDEALAAATKDFICGDSAFAPSVGQLRQAGLALLMDPSDRITGAEAWEPVAQWLVQPCSVRPWGDHANKAVLASCGEPWGMSLAIREEREKIGPVRAAFIKAYDAARERRIVGRHQHPDVRKLADGHLMEIEG